MRARWLNGGLLLEPENPIECEAMLVLLRSIRYELPEGYDEDGGQSAPPPDATGSCNSGSELM